jgi:putative oxidoreductase
MEQIKKRRGLNIFLWVLQAILALMFLNAAYLKALRPIQEIAPTIFWVTYTPEPLVRFIGMCEFLGAVGLILPALLKIRPQLTTLAAAGLSTIMLLANAMHIVRGEYYVLPMTMVIFLLVLFVAYGRWKLVPIAPKG